MNQKLAAVFQQMADIVEITGGNRFRAISFQKTARLLAELADDVAELDVDSLTAIDGIGKGTAERIREYIDTGHMDEYERLIEEVPAGLLKLLDIPGLGPKTVAVLWKQAGVTSITDLKAAIHSGKLKDLPGFGEKKIENIHKNLAFATEAGKRFRIGSALPLAQWFVQQLRKMKTVKEAAYAGSLRRGRETIGDIDILVAADPKHAADISHAFMNLEVVEQLIAGGETKTSVRTRQGIQVDLRIVPPDSFGAAMMYFTGSKDHNVRMRERAASKSMKLNEYGLYRQVDETFVAGRTEQEVFKSLGLQWIPPELREDRGELAMAENMALPVLIELNDIQAELHAHTTASDGMWSIRELAAAVADRGFHTVAVTDHSKSQAQANGLSAERLEKHIEAVHEVASKMKNTITVLAGTEVDIRADGKLDYPNSLLKVCDIVVASPHSALSQDPAACTKRLLKAIHNPYVTILGHPTGRIVNKREGFHPDMKQVFKAAVERGIAIEINANHYRLDLRDTHARAAIESGVKLAINTDAHGPADLDELKYGIHVARRAGATKTDVVNCMSRSELKKWIASTRP